jgi:hypothetical protein
MFYPGNAGLNNAQTWRGEVARRVKRELKAILKDHPLR